MPKIRPVKICTDSPSVTIILNNEFIICGNKFSWYVLYLYIGIQVPEIFYASENCFLSVSYTYKSFSM